MYIKGLNYRYPKSGRDTLKDVSFRLDQNKLNVLIGLNGAGKTTLFDCMTQTLSVSHGEVHLPDISETLYLTQNIFYSSELYGKDMTMFIGRLAELDGFKDPETYLVGLGTDRERELFLHLWDMKLGKMSVGERKWLFVILLARIDRKLYIFDEPTSGVDPSSRKNIMSTLGNIVGGDSTCLISTHQLHDLQHVPSNVIFLHDGRVLYQGDFQDWLDRFDTNDPDEAFVEMIDSYIPLPQ